MTSVLRGGEGVPSEADIVSNLSKGGCMNLRARGEGSTNPTFLWTSLMEAPLCLRKGMGGLHVPRVRQDAGTRNPSIPFLRHKVQYNKTRVILKLK